MSAEITYKNEIITTVDNETKTLATAGKYLEGNIIITDESINVNTQSKTVTPTANAQVITPDTGYDYLTQVTVNAIPYNESDNSAGGVTVTIG